MIGDAPRKGEEEQTELGVALVGLCFLESNMEKPAAQCPVQLEGQATGAVVAGSAVRALGH